MMPNTREQCAYDRGVHDKKKGLTEKANPYKKRPKEQAAWLLGFNAPL